MYRKKKENSDISKILFYTANYTRLTRGARPALAGFFKARQYPRTRFPIHDLTDRDWCLTASRVCYNGDATVNAAKVSTSSREGIVTVPVSDS